MAFIRSGNSGGGGGTLQETTLANFTVSGNGGTTTKSIGVPGANIIAVYGTVTYTNTFVILSLPTRSAVQIGETSGWRDSTTLTVTFSGDSFTTKNTLSSTATFKNIRVLYEV